MLTNDKVCNIAILTENGFEQSELVSPKDALENAGHLVDVISPQSGNVKAWDEDHWGIEVPVDVPLDAATPEDYDMLILPGGVLNPDTLRVNEKALAFVRHFVEQGKPIASICHGPQVLINAGVAKGRKLTSYASIKQDLINAGANWVDQEVVSEDGLITSRSPKDLEAFNDTILKTLQEERKPKSKKQSAKV